MKDRRNHCGFSRSWLLTSLAWLVLAVASLAETVVWQENFDDGKGDDRWAAGNGVWQIGSPTFGASTNSAGYRAHSGSACATSGLTADYPKSPDSRLVRLQSFQVPDATQYPRLRFWHWFDFGKYVAGSVEIREAGTPSGSWVQLSPDYTADSSGVWTHPSLDLRGYAGKTIQVAFRIRPTGGLTVNGPGWYVDDVGLATGTPVFNNPEGFESGLADWSAENGAWEVGVPTSGPPTNHLGFRAFAGKNCAATVLAGKYSSGLDHGVDSRLVSPDLIVPPAAANPALRFRHWYQFGAYMQGVVEILATGGEWVPISSNFVGSSGEGWSNPFISLASYAGQSVKIGFRIRPTSPLPLGGLGWYLDNVEISADVISPIPDFVAVQSSLWAFAPTVIGQGYTFSLAGAPQGMAVDPRSGQISWTPAPSQAPGWYTNIVISVTQAGSSLTPIASQSFSVRVMGIPVLSWSAPSDVVYGTPLTSTQLDAISSVPGKFVYLPALGEVLHAGRNQSLGASFAPLDAYNYTNAGITTRITILPAPLRVFAKDASRSYGDSNPAFSATFSGFVNGDTASVISGSPSFACNSTAESPVDAYVIKLGLGTLSASDYTFDSFVDATLTVRAAPLAITASNRTKIFGQTVSFSGNEFTTIGLVNGDKVTSASMASSGVAPTAPAGDSPYVINISNALGNAGLTNYTITYQKGLLMVTQAVLAIWAIDQKKTYGERVSFTGKEFTANGLQNGETVGSVTSTSPGAVAAALVVGSPYPISVSGATGGTFNPANYFITYQPGLLTVNPAPLHITAASRSKTYGETVYFTGKEFSASGLQNSETVGSVSLTSSGALATASVANLPYSIVPSAPTGGTFNLANYTTIYQNGTLAVNPAALTITANDDKKAFGLRRRYGPGSTSFSSNGLQNGETIGWVTITASGGTNASDPVMSYSLVPSAATGGTFIPGNYYPITYRTGTLRVVQQNFVQGDVNVDGKPDVLWESTDGQHTVWYQNGLTNIGWAYLHSGQMDPAWRLVGIGDFNGDEKSDLIWESADGQHTVWYEDGLKNIGWAYLHAGKMDPAWRIAGVADFNQDGKSDLVWESADGQHTVWYQDGITNIGWANLHAGKMDPSWRIVGVGDFNYDGKPDLVWESGDGQHTVWYQDGVKNIGWAYLHPGKQDPAWRIVGVADFNGDGSPDVVWESVDGQHRVWYEDGVINLGSDELHPGKVDPTWRIVGLK